MTGYGIWAVLAAAAALSAALAFAVTPTGCDGRRERIEIGAVVMGERCR